jgi:hypothetical protein
MTFHPRATTGWLLLGQGAVLGLLALIGPVVMTGYGPPDDLTIGEEMALQDQALAMSAVLVLLSALSVVLAVVRLVGGPIAPLSLVPALLAAAVAVAVFGSTVLVGCLVLAAGGWAVLLRRDVVRPVTPLAAPATVR